MLQQLATHLAVERAAATARDKQISAARVKDTMRLSLPPRKKTAEQLAEEAAEAAAAAAADPNAGLPDPAGSCCVQ